MNEQRDWQRETALRKVRESREASNKAGAPMSDQRLAAAAAAYVGAKTEDVLRWMKGAV